MVPDVIKCAFAHFKLRILDMVDFDQYIEFRASNENFVSSIASEMSSLTNKVVSKYSEALC